MLFQSCERALLEIFLDGRQEILDGKAVLLEGDDPEPDVEADQDQDEGGHANLKSQTICLVSLKAVVFLNQIMPLLKIQIEFL